MRIRGRVIETKEGFSWEIFITELGSNEGNLLSCNTLYKTKDEALENLRLAAKMGCDAVQTYVLGKPTNHYIDMKTNETRSWGDVH